MHLKSELEYGRLDDQRDCTNAQALDDRNSIDSLQKHTSQVVSCLSE